MSECSPKDLENESSLALSIDLSDVSSQVRNLQRRSSIFKKGSFINYTFNESKLENGTDFQSNQEKMKHEILKWKNSYVEIKNDYKSYIKSKPKDTFLEDKFAKEHLFDNYITKAKSFMFHVSNVVEMYKHLKQYEDLQLEQMNHLNTHLEKKIQKKLNL